MGLFVYRLQVRIHALRIQDSGFRKRTINHSLMIRQLISGYRGSKEIHKSVGTPPCTYTQPGVSVSSSWRSNINKGRAVKSGGTGSAGGAGSAGGSVGAGALAAVGITGVS